MQCGELVFEQLRHLNVPAVASHLHDVTERQRFGTVFQEKVGHRQLVLADGEGERRPVLEVRAHQRWVFGHQLFDRLELPGDAGAEHRPDIGANAGRPQPGLLMFQDLRLNQPCDPVREPRVLRWLGVFQSALDVIHMPFEVLPGSVEPRLDDVARDAKKCGDLLVRAATHVEQEDGLLPSAGQSGDRVTQPPAILARLQHFVRRRRWRREIERRFEPGRRQPLPPRHAIAVLEDYRAEPAAEGAWFLQRPQVPKRVDECLLGGVLAQLIVPEDGRRICDCAVLMQPDQLREGELVAGLSTQDQVANRVAIGATGRLHKL